MVAVRIHIGNTVENVCGCVIKANPATPNRPKDPHAVT